MCGKHINLVPKLQKKILLQPAVFRNSLFSHGIAPLCTLISVQKLFSVGLQGGLVLPQGSRTKYLKRAVGGPQPRLTLCRQGMQRPIRPTGGATSFGVAWDGLRLPGVCQTCCWLQELSWVVVGISSSLISLGLTHLAG